MLLEKGSRLMMIGDSITDCGRKMPIGEGHGAEGFGYVAFVSALIKSVYPENGYRVVNMGTSGDKVRELKARWQNDVIDLSPNYLSIMVGINDIWRQFEHPFNTAEHVYIDEYRETLEELIIMAMPNIKKIILISPFFVESNENDPMKIEVKKYAQVMAELAEKHDAIFVDTQKVFDDLLKTAHSSAYALDRVHPNGIGHMAIAKAFLDAIGFEWKV